MQVNILEAKNRLSRLIKSAHAGEDVIIANRGEPVARLLPITTSPSAEGEKGNGQAILEWLASHPLPSHARRSVEEIDRGIVEERGAWD